MNDDDLASNARITTGCSGRRCAAAEPEREPSALGVMMYRQLTVIALGLLLTCGLSASAEDRDAPEAKPMLEGVLKVYPKFLYKYYLVTDAGQTCALYEPEQRAGEFLSKIEPGSRVRVSGSLGTRLHPGGTKDNPSPFGRTWVIYMDVEKVETLAAARVEG